MQARRKKKECLMRSWKQIVYSQALPKNWPEYFQCNSETYTLLYEQMEVFTFLFPLGKKRIKEKIYFAYRILPRLVKIWTKAVLHHCDEASAVVFVTCTRYHKHRYKKDGACIITMQDCFCHQESEEHLVVYDNFLCTKKIFFNWHPSFS